MGLTLETVVFYFLAVFIIAMSILTVTTQRIVRSATYLLFVLFGTAGIYFLLGYTFLGSVQIMVLILISTGSGSLVGTNLCVSVMKSTRIAHIIVVTSPARNLLRFR